MSGWAQITSCVRCGGGGGVTCVRSRPRRVFRVIGGKGVGGAERGYSKFARADFGAVFRITDGMHKAENLQGLSATQSHIISTTLLPLIYFALTVTDCFGPTEGSKLLKPSGNKRTLWGDRQVDRIKLAAVFTSRGAPGALAPP